jgi:hypothetical protein
MWVTVAAQFKARAVFDHFKTGIAISNFPRAVDIQNIRLFHVLTLPCVAKGLALG